MEFSATASSPASTEKSPYSVQSHQSNLLAAQAGKLLGWRLHSTQTSLGLALAFASIVGGVLAFRLPVVFLMAALDGILGGLLLFTGFRRLPRVVRIVGGAGCGLFLAALPCLATQFGVDLIFGLILAGLIVLLNVRHAVIVLCLLASCAWAGIGWLLGSLMGGYGADGLLGLSIVFGLASLGLNLFVFVLNRKSAQTEVAPQALNIACAIRKKQRTVLLAGLALVVAALFCVMPVCRHAGLPLSEERTQPMLRVMVYLRHWEQNDFVPIWSGTDGYGLGSPEPFYYHKLFYLVYTFVIKMTGDVKAGTVLSIILFLCIGSLGILLTGIKCGLRLSVAVMLAITLIFTNYTYTDWLVRGSVAEFSAAMLIPWLLYWCIGLLKDEFSLARFIWLGFLMTALAHAHNTIAMSCVGVVAWAFVLRAVRRVRELPKLLGGGACALGLFLLLAAPFLWVAWRLDPYYDLSKMVYAVFLPGRFCPFALYLWDAYWHWGQDWTLNGPLHYFTVQLDIFVVGGLVGLILYLSGSSLWRRLRPPSGVTAQTERADVFVWVFLVGLSALLLFLQTSSSSAIWSADIVHFLLYLQLPWRLLAILTPALLLLLAAALAAARLRNNLQLGLAALIMLGTIACSAAPRPIAHNWFWYSAENLAGTQTSQELSFLSENVYLPIVGHKIDAKRYYEYASSNEYYQMAKTYGAENCKLQREPLDSESMHSGWQVEMRAHGACVFPLAFTPLHRVFIKGEDQADFRAQPAYCTETDPRIHVDLRPGNYRVWIRNPSFPAMLGFYAPPNCVE